MREKVLVLEDEQQLQRLFGVVLEGLGYEPFLAGDCREGMKMLHGNIFLAALIDLGLPGISGPECWEWLGTQCPTLKVIFMSGSHDCTPKNHLFLRKPFSMKELSDTLKGI